MAIPLACFTSDKTGGVTLNGVAGVAVSVVGTIGYVMVVDTIVLNTVMPKIPVPHALSASTTSSSAAPRPKAKTDEKTYV